MKHNQIRTILLGALCGALLFLALLDGSSAAKESQGPSNLVASGSGRYVLNQLSTAQNRTEATAERENQDELQKTKLPQTASSDNIRIAINDSALRETQLGRTALPQTQLRSTDNTDVTGAAQFVLGQNKFAFYKENNLYVSSAEGESSLLGTDIKIKQNKRFITSKRYTYSSMPRDVLNNMKFSEGMGFYSALQSADESTWLLVERSMENTSYNLCLYDSGKETKVIFSQDNSPDRNYAFMPIAWSNSKDVVYLEALIFGSATENEGIWSYNMVTKQFSRLSISPSYLTTPVISPDGKYFIYGGTTDVHKGLHSAMNVVFVYDIENETERIVAQDRNSWFSIFGWVDHNIEQSDLLNISEEEAPPKESSNVSVSSQPSFKLPWNNGVTYYVSRTGSPAPTGTIGSTCFSNYGFEPHTYIATDFDSPNGVYDPVRASAAGTVIYAQFNSGGYGNLVKIRHYDNTITYYAHLNTISVSVNDVVQQGCEIGDGGTTGNSTGDHIHFEWRDVNDVRMTTYPIFDECGCQPHANYCYTSNNNTGSCSGSNCLNDKATLRNRDNGPPIHPPGSVIKTSSSSTAYLIDPDNRKRPITSASVLAQLYNQSTDARTSTNFSNWVITVDQDELDLYEQGGNISAAQPGNGKPFPDGKLISYNGEVSIVTGGGNRRPFAAASTFTGLGFQFCQVVNVSSSEYFSYPVGPPVDAMALLTSSLNLSPSSPYVVGQNISGTFGIKNVGFQAISFSSLGVGGRLNGGAYDLGFISRTLTPGESYTFTSGSKQLSSAGTYDFFAAYQETNGHWSVSVPAMPGIVRSRQISVQQQTCNAPGAFSLSLPSNGQSFGSSTTSVTLSWGQSANANSYDVYFGTTSNPPFYTNTQATSLNVSVSSGQTYYWKVIAKVTCGSATYSTSVSSFSIQSGVSCAAAQMTSPSNGATIQPTTTFTWNTGGGNAEYWLYVGTTVGGSDIYTGSQGTSTSKTLSNLPSGTTLYVRLWSRCASNNTWTYNDYSYVVVQVVACGAAAQMTSPSNGATIQPTTTFNWNTGSGNAEYWLYVGTTVGGSDIYTGSQGTSTSKTLNNLPSGNLYVRLWSRCASNNTWTYNDYSYVVGNIDTCLASAQMTSPANGATIQSTTTFNWNTGSGNAEYWLYVGTTVTGADVYNASQGTSTSKTLNNLPSGTLYVRLWSRCASTNTWTYNDYSFVVQTSGGGTCASAQMTSPTNGATIQSSTTFNWNTGNLNAEYWLYVGTTVTGADVYNASQGTSTSKTLNNLPSGTLYVRLWSRCAATNTWTFNDYSYVVPGGCASAQMTAPSNGVTIQSSTTFTWNTGSGNAEYWLYLGTSPSASDIYTGSQGTNTSKTFSNLPAGNLYVRLWSRCAATNTWTFNDYSYVVQTSGGGTCASAQMTSPTNGATIQSTTTFNWNTGSGNAEYWLYLGTSPSASNIYTGSQGTSLSKAFSNLPAGNLYVRLWSRCAATNAWTFNDYSYVVQTSGAQLTPYNGIRVQFPGLTMAWFGHDLDNLPARFSNGAF